MRLPTKQLINKIENLSNGLTPEQLTSFLDIIDAMTALVEEAAAAADSLQQQAIGLSERVAMFKLDGGSMLAPPPKHSSNVTSKPAMRVAANTGRALKPSTPSENEWESF